MDIDIRNISDEELIKYIEKRRLDNLINEKAEQRRFQEEYESYMESRREYSFETMRDYGHTWGPGIDDVYDDDEETVLPDDLKVDERQLEIVRKCRERYADEEECMEAVENILLMIYYEEGGYLFQECESFEEMAAKFEEDKLSQNNDLTEDDEDLADFFN